MPEKPELEAVAWLCAEESAGRAVTLRKSETVGYSGIGWEVTDLCSLPAAQALLRERDDRIADLEAKLARLRPIARAAVLYAEERRNRARSVPSMLAPLVNEIVLAVDALSERERSELLEETENG